LYRIPVRQPSQFPESTDVPPALCRKSAPNLPKGHPALGADSVSRLNLLYNSIVPETATTRLDRVLAQLRLYEHPLLNFSARAKGEGVEIIIQFKDASVPVHTYYFDLHPRDLDHPQFEWSFQRQLYDALHDYFVEMFIRTPQDRADRRRKEL
jgi:hypothetical protein